MDFKKIIQNVIPIRKQYPDFNNEKIEKKINNILLDFFSKRIILSLNKINFFKDDKYFSQLSDKKFGSTIIQLLTNVSIL